LNEKRQTIDAKTEMNQMLEFSNMNFKEIIIKMIQQTIENSLEINDK
jgi:hypothetical protein